MGMISRDLHITSSCSRAHIVPKYDPTNPQLRVERINGVCPVNDWAAATVAEEFMYKKRSVG